MSRNNLCAANSIFFEVIKLSDGLLFAIAQIHF